MWKSRVVVSVGDRARRPGTARASAVPFFVRVRLAVVNVAGSIGSENVTSTESTPGLALGDRSERQDRRRDRVDRQGGRQG